MSRPAGILLISDHRRQLHRWARALDGPETQLWSADATLPAADAVDVIVTDRAITAEWLPDCRYDAPLARGEIGLVRLGEKGPADVALSAQPTASELRLACRLLAQVARLRQRCARQQDLLARLRQMAMSDPLTQLPNRRAWQERLAATTPGGQPLPQPKLGNCVALLDLDHFKRINEHAGHIGGDRILRQVGGRLAAGRQTGIFAARLGGDEFGLILHAPHADAALQSVENLRVAVCRHVVPYVTASAGLAFAAQYTPLNDLFFIADQELRKAKSAGRNRTSQAEMLTKTPDATSASTP